MKNTSCNNREHSSSPMGSLDSICLQMADNLSYTRSRSDYDKKQLHELKQEFSKVFNDLIANKKIVDLYLE